MKIIDVIDKYNWNQYYEIAGVIKNELDNKLENKVILNEYLAFQLFIDYKNLSNRGTYFWPFMTLNNWDWTVTESPWKSYITVDTINYWKKRIKETSNLFIKFRYLDLIYDLEENITWKSTDYKTIIDLIETWIKAIKERKFTDLDWKNILKRLLSIIISIGKIEEYKEILSIIMDYEKFISSDDKPWLWGFSFDYLIHNKKIKLDKKYEEVIINGLESKLNRLNDIYLIKFCWERLAKYYKYKNDSKNLLRVLLRIKDVNYNVIKDNKDWLLVANYFQELINLFSIYQDVKEVKNEKDNIINDFQRKIKETKIDYKNVETSFTITDKEMQDYINYFFIKEDRIIQRICIWFTINKKHSKEILDWLIKDYPLQFLISKKILDKNWLPIHTIKWIYEDYDWNLYHQITQDLHISSVFIDKVLEKFIEKYSVDDLVNELMKNGLSEQEDEKFIKNIFENYYKWNYLEFNFLVIPFVEKLFRRLNEMLGITILNYKDDKIEYKSLDYLITSWVVRDLFRSRWDDFELYFRLILTMIEGWNLRNNLAHGIELNYFYDKNVSNRLFHILLCFSLIRLVELNNN